MTLIIDKQNITYPDPLLFTSPNLIVRDPISWKWGKVQDHYIFTDLFLTTTNDTLVIISRAYPDFKLHHSEVSLYFSNAPIDGASMTEGMLPCDVTLNASNALYDFHTPCYCHMNRPTKQKYHGNLESSVTQWYTHRYIRLIVNEFKGIYAVFKYRDKFSPAFRILARPLMKKKYISMYTLFKQLHPVELETWFTYYALLGVEHFMMYYNGNSICINPTNCTCSGSSCGPCMSMSCFIKQLATMNKIKFNVPLHPVLSSVSFEFVAWDYIYTKRVPKSVSH